MPDNIIERRDIGSLGAQAQNRAIYGVSNIAEIQSDFGAPKVPVFIYNISNQEFNIPRPPNHPHMLLRACPIGQPYALVGTIEHPFREVHYDQNDNQIVKLTVGPVEATKMLNPMNPGIDQDWDGPSLLEGGNLNAFGCFWSMHNPPLESELEAARKRLEKTYRKELETMVAVEAKEGPDGARNRANDISHAAANYFNQSYSWHRTDLIPKEKMGQQECGACGEKINIVAKLCRHCGAPTDPKKLDAWIESKTEVKRGPGRPSAA
jgi:hypothetical protein